MGLLEVHGLTAAIGAADAMAKAAPILVDGPFLVGNGLVTVIARGEIAAVSEAVEAGATAAVRLGRLTARHVIGRPSGEVDTIFEFQHEVTPPT